MIKFFKKLFCKHQFNTLYIQPSKNNIEIVYLERKCFKCGKEIKGWYEIPGFNRYYWKEI